nr:hypothetical protein [Tanacetum cinerariifolium]
MELESIQTSTTAKLPMFKQGDYKMSMLRIKKYFYIQDYALWDVIENGNSFKLVAQTTTNNAGTSTILIPSPVTTGKKAQKKNDVKEKSMLLMELHNEHLITFNQYKDAKTLFATIETRFDRNEATKKTQKTLRNQLYENFNLNLKFVRSLPSEWNTHVVVCRNKSDLDTMSINDLYNNFKIVEQENQDISRRTVNVEETPPKAIVAIDGVGSDWSYMAEDEVPTNMALMTFLDSERERVVSRNNNTRVNYNNSTRKTYPNAHKNIALRAVLMQTGLRPLNTARLINTAHPKTIVHYARPMSCFSKSAQSTVKRPYQQRTTFTNKSFRQTINTARPRLVNTTRPRPVNTVRSRPVNTTRPNSAVVNVVRANKILRNSIEDMLPLGEEKMVAELLVKELFTLNMALIVKPHNKTLYELFRGRTPSLSFMKPIGCHVTFLNTLDHLGKFNGKVDKGYFVGYSMDSNAFRVYNIRTRRVEENLHIEFLESNLIVAGARPKWLFDINMLTESMNYVPVIAGTNSNDFSGSLFDSSSKNATNDEPQSSCDARNKDDNGVNKDSEIDAHEKSANSINDVNTVGPNINTTSTDFDTSSLNINTISPTISTASPEATHVDFLGDQPEGDMYNINTTYQVPSTLNTRIHKDHSLDLVIGDVGNVRRATPVQTTTGFMVYQMDVKSAFLYGRIKEEVYVDDIIFGSTKKELCNKFERLMKVIFQMSSMGKITFFLGLEVKQREDGIFISQDKYVTEVLRKFNFSNVKSASTLVEMEKPLVKDAIGVDVDVHLYRSMIGSLMYLTTSRPDIMYVVCVCARFQVTPKCKKQTMVATSTTEAEYVVAASCYGQERMNEEDMFGVNDLDGDEVIVDVTAGENVEHSTKNAEKEVSTADPVTTAGEVVITTKDVEVAAAITLQISKDELILAQTLMEIKEAKPKIRGVIIQEPSKFRTTSSLQPSQLPQAKDKEKEDDTAELKRCLEIVLEDDEDLTIKATPLSSKSPTIVDYKIYKEGKKSYFKIIRADGNSQSYLTFGKMFKNFKRDDLEVLWSIVKERFKKTKPVDDMDNLLFQTLKTMFEHHAEDNI